MWETSTRKGHSSGSVGTGRAPETGACHPLCLVAGLFPACVCVRASSFIRGPFALDQGSPTVTSSLDCLQRLCFHRDWGLGLLGLPYFGETRFTPKHLPAP